MTGTRVSAVTAYTAHREWASRPRDERYVSVHALHEAARESLKELLPWMRWCEPDFSLADSAAWIEFTKSGWEKTDSYNFAIVELAGSRRPARARSGPRAGCPSACDR